jgi:zinc protease
MLALFFSIQSQPIQPVWAQTSNASWQVHQEKLANGLTVLLLEDHRSPVITLQVWYKVGGRNEQLGRTGISHLLEHLMFRGTTKYGEGEFTRLVKEKGGNLNAFTSADHTVYFERVTAAHLDLMLDLESDRLANLILDEKGIEAERQIVMEERRMRTSDNPASDLWEQLSAAA